MHLLDYFPYINKGPAIGYPIFRSQVGGYIPDCILAIALFNDHKCHMVAAVDDVMFDIVEN